jgi:hypothetical protein
MSVVFSAPLESWPSGRRRTPGKCVYGNVSRVRIPRSPPHTEPIDLAKFSVKCKSKAHLGHTMATVSKLCKNAQARITGIHLNQNAS